MANRDSDQVAVGTSVRIAGFGAGEEEQFHLVAEEHADYVRNRIPPSSPLARALDGARVGDKVLFYPPNGEVELTVVEVQPWTEDTPNE